ncbi:MAG: chemotaxis protein CheX [Lachnospiraceae bacterium]
MAGIKAEQINPFLISAKQVLQQVCQIDVRIGTITKDDVFINGEPLFIMLGVTGEITGQVLIVMDNDVAKDIASRMMMGMPVNEIDDMARSALSELGNMVMGNAATILSNNNTMIDITPPTLMTGNTKITAPDISTVKVPLLYQNYEIKLYFLLKPAK